MSIRLSERAAPRMTSTLRYAALLIPEFRLQAVLHRPPRQSHESPPPPPPATPRSKSTRRHVPAPHTQACALVDPQSAKSVLLEVNARARQCGIEPGMTGSQALAREPGVRLMSACTTAEHALGEKLLGFCESLCPRVEKRAPSLWMLDLRGLRVTDWERWAREALVRLETAPGVRAQLGIAPRPALALCAARRADPVRIVEQPDAFVDDLRFEELGVSQALVQKLHDWGIMFLGELLRLPRQAALERLGPEAAPLWEIARDSRESVLRLESFQEALEQGLEFEVPLETLDPLIFGLNRMVEQLCSRLRLLQRVAAQMELCLQLEGGDTYRHRFTVPAPCREEAVLVRILQTHLETLHFDTGVAGASLRFEASLAASRQLALFESPLRDANRFGETLARLRALAGEDCVGVALPRNSHRPDAFELADPLELFGGQSPPPAEALPAGSASLHGESVGLPLRRFRPALAARVQVRAHQPAHVAADGLDAPVLESRGPFRLCGDWWDEQAWNHEQWDVLLGGRARGLYRLGCHAGPENTAPRVWWVEGCYDGLWWPARPQRP